MKNKLLSYSNYKTLAVAAFSLFLFKCLIVSVSLPDSIILTVLLLNVVFQQTYSELPSLLTRLEDRVTEVKAEAQKLTPQIEELKGKVNAINVKMNLTKTSLNQKS